MGGKAAVEAAKDKGWDKITAIGIMGVQGDSTSEARIAGFKQGIAEAGGEYLSAETQYADSVADKAVTCMEAIIQAHPEGVSIIVANNDDMAAAPPAQLPRSRRTRIPSLSASAAIWPASTRSSPDRRP